MRPITPSALVDELADRIAAAPTPGAWTRVLLDGPAPADPVRWADALVDPLRIRGHPALRISAEDFLRPASLRLEHGHHDPDAYYTDRLDLPALRREVFAPLDPGGTGLVLPRFWDAERNRHARADYVALPSGGVLLLDGSLLLGWDLPADLRIHLQLTDAVLRRRLPDDEAWTLPAHRRYAEEARPTERADVVLRVDHPDRPATSG